MASVGKKVSVVRNTQTAVEAAYWNFAQDTIGVPSELKDDLCRAWTRFSSQLIDVILGTLVTVKDDPTLKDFFSIEVDELPKATTVLGGDTDVLLKLNSRPIQRSERMLDGTQIEIWGSLGNDIVLTQQLIESVSRDLVTAVEYIQKSNNPQSRKWVLLPNKESKERLVFTFQYDRFRVNVFPVFKTLGDSFVFISNDAGLGPWDNWEENLRLNDEDYPGFFELIKFCKLLLNDWNSKGITYISSLVFEVITTEVCSNMKTQEWTKSSSFYALCNKVLQQFQESIKNRPFKIQNRDLLPELTDADANKLLAWIDEVISKPKQDKKLLDFAEEVWKASKEREILSHTVSNANNNAVIQSVIKTISAERLTNLTSSTKLKNSQSDSDNEYKHQTSSLKNSQNGIPTQNALQQLPASSLKKGDLLGEGAFAKVYKGTWAGVTVALKELKLDNLTPDMQQDFMKEATILAKCISPNVIRFYGVNTESSHNIIVMEFAPKGSLYSVLHSQSVSLPWDLRLCIASGIARGVDYLHTNKIVHSDLKSLNVLLDENYQPKLTDFGLAKIKLETQTKTKVAASSSPSGSTRWVAPEILEGEVEGPTFSSDIYSMGMVFWEISSRKRPYENQANEQIVIAWIMKGKQEKIPDDCPPQLSKIIQMCWDKPENRPQASKVCECLGEPIRKRFRDVVTRETQWQELCFILDNSNWRNLGDLLGKTVLELNDIDRRTKESSPTKVMLSEWQHSSNAYVDVFINALTEIGNDTAVQLVESWTTRG